MHILIDVNVLHALVYEESQNHREAIQWLGGIGGDTIVVCRVTQHGLLRLLTLPQVMKGNVRTMEQAWGVYDGLMSDTRFRFVWEPEGMENLWRNLCPASIVAPQKWTDAYLAAFAIASGMQFVTFDRGFRDFRGLNLKLLGQPALHEDMAIYTIEQHAAP